WQQVWPSKVVLNPRIVVHRVFLTIGFGWSCTFPAPFCQMLILFLAACGDRMVLVGSLVCGATMHHSQFSGDPLRLLALVVLALVGCGQPPDHPEATAPL